jgi:hypothetical protein
MHINKAVCQVETTPLARCVEIDVQLDVQQLVLARYDHDDLHLHVNLIMQPARLGWVI